MTYYRNGIFPVIMMKKTDKDRFFLIFSVEKSDLTTFGGPPPGILLIPYNWEYPASMLL